MSTPVVSVVIPMYQSAATVAETVRSVQADFAASGLDGERGEIVVVNDGSRDRGPEIVAGLAAEDARIRLISQNNHGLAGARNTGLDAARAEWVRFLDADDLATPGSSGKLIELAERAGTGAACGSHHLIDESGTSMGRVSCAVGDVGGCIGLDELLTSNRMGVGTVLMRRDKIGPMRFDERLRVCEDWDLWLRLAQAGQKWAVAPAWCGPMKLYRVRRGSLSKNFEMMLEVGSDVLRRAFARIARAGDGAGRCERAVRGQALAFAAMRAVSHVPEASGRAAAMLPSAEGFVASQLAEAALWGVLLGLGERPELAGPERERWLGQLREWWGRVGVVTEADAVRQLAGLVVPPGAIATACIEQVRRAGAREVVIVGAGHNGMVVIDAARASGMSFMLRDDRLCEQRRHGLHSTLGRLVQPMLAPLAPGQVVVCTPDDDGKLVDRLCSVVPTASIVRWRQVREVLARAEQDAIERVEAPPQLVGA